MSGFIERTTSVPVLPGAREDDSSSETSSSGFSGWNALLLLGAVVAGIAAILQTTFNAGLALLLREETLQHPKSDIVAANVSFAVSSILLIILTALSHVVPSRTTEDSNEPERKASSDDQRADSNWLVFFSYAASSPIGATHIVLKVIASPILGLGLDYLFVMLGQLVASLIIDWGGLLGVKQTSPDWVRFAAIGLAFIGALLVCLGGEQQYESSYGLHLVIGAAALATIAGALHPCQAATMGVLSRRYPNPWFVALISFSGGVIWLTAVSALALTFDRHEGEMEGDWLAATVGDLRVFDVLGGVFGVTFLALTIVVTPLLGINSFYIVSVAGQLLAAVLVDAAPSSEWKHALPTIEVSPLRILGISVALAGIVLLVLPSRWFKSERREYEHVE